MIKNIIKLAIFILIIELYVVVHQTITEEIKEYNEKVSIDNILNIKNSKPVKINDENDYEMIIEISKINLKKGILKKENKHNNIEENVTLLKESKYPNEGGNIYIAAHSGTGKHAFFNDLSKLKINDEIDIYYQKNKYTYQINEIKKISKIENSSVITKNKNNLILITCSQEDKSKYLVVISNKIKETELNN